MRRQLDQESELSLDGKEVYVRDGRGRSITIDQRIAQLKPLYGFPPDPTKPAPLRIPNAANVGVATQAVESCCRALTLRPS